MLYYLHQGCDCILIGRGQTPIGANLTGTGRSVATSDRKGRDGVNPSSTQRHPDVVRGSLTHRSVEDGLAPSAPLRCPPHYAPHHAPHRIPHPVKFTVLAARGQHLRGYMLTQWQKWKKHPLSARVGKTVAIHSTTISKNFQARMIDLARPVTASSMLVLCSVWIIAMIVLNYIIMTPLLNIFWADHLPGVREQRIEQLLAMIPPDAAVSASGSLNPHLTERQYVTVFPELTVATMQPGVTVPVEYVIVDLTNVSPEDKNRSTPFIAYLNGIQHTHQFRTLARADGVILLKRKHP